MRISVRIVRRAKVHGAAAAAFLLDASRYFVTPLPVILPLPKGALHVYTTSPTGKWATAESFKVWTRSQRRGRGKEMLEPEASRVGKERSWRVDGEESTVRKERQER